MDDSDFVSNSVWDHTEKLEKFYDRIMSCHVIIEAPHRHHHLGKIYHVKVRLHVAGGDIFVTTEREKNRAHENVYVAIRDAFDAARRKLEDFIRIQRGIIKQKNLKAHGKVSRLFQDESCGFISTPDDREVYFHKNAVLRDEFDRLKVGEEVRFSEEMGEKGPQATSLTRVGKSGHLNARV